MSQVILTIPNSRVQDVLDAFGYQAKLEDGSNNPETAQAFMKRIIKQWVEIKVKNYLTDKAQKEIVVNNIVIT